MAYDAREWLTAPVVPNQYKPDFAKYADEVLNYVNARGDKAFEQDMEKRRLNREEERDRNADERDRVSQEQHARQLLMANERDKEREGLYGRQEERRQEQAMFERNRLLKQEHEALIAELWHAINDPGQDSVTRQNRIRAAQDALHREGYGTQAVEQGPGAQQQSLQAAPARAAPAERPAAPMSKQDQATSSALDQADAFYSKGLGAAPSKPAKPARSKGTDANLDSQLNDIDKRYSEGLGVKPWLPGQSAVPHRASPDVARSDAMLSEDDPYNQLVR